MTHYDQRRRALRALRGQRSAADVCRAYRSQPAVDSGRNTEAEAHGFRLGLVGSPLTWNALLLLDAIEEAGGRLVFDATENGEGGLCESFDPDRLDTAPLQELARAYCASIQHIGRRPNTAFFKWLKQRLDTDNLQGLIVHRQPWCDLWHAEIPRLRALSQVPLLDLESTGMEPGQQARLVTRIQAFVETLS